MSHSYRSVRTEEYDRLRREAQNAERLQSENETIRANAAAREREINSLYKKNLDSLNSRITQVRQESSAEVNRISRDFRSRLAEQSAQHAKDFENVNNRVSAVDNKVNEMEEYFNSRFDEFERTSSDKRERANRNSQLLDDVLYTIGQLRPDKFEPGKLADLKRLRDDAGKNIQNGDYEAAIATLEGGIRSAHKLAARLTILNNEFNTLLRETSLRANKIRERIESFEPSNGNTIEFSFEGEDYCFEYDITHWAGEQYNAIKTRMSGLLQQLEEAPASQLDIQGLERLSNEFRHVDSDLSDCDRLGRDEMVRSCVAEDMVKRIHNFLSDKGWSAFKTEHLDNDDRQPYQMIYTDGAGNKVAIVIHGTENPESPSFSAHPDSDNDFVKNNVLDWIADGLQDVGVDLSPPEKSEACEANPTAEEFAHNVALAHSKQKLK